MKSSEKRFDRSGFRTTGVRLLPTAYCLRIARGKKRTPSFLNVTFLLLLCVQHALAQKPSPVVLESPLQVSGTRVVADEIELRWDFNEPVGYMALSDGDTACVTFPAIPGGRLDSLRIGLRRAGPISGEVWRHGSTGSPLRPPRLAQFLAFCSNTPSVPYPDPWTNWAVVDLSAEALSTDSSFTVSIINRGDPQIAQRVMVTEFVGSPAHSYTYLQASDSVKGPGWYVLPVAASPDTTYAYLVRAYVATPTAIPQDQSAGIPTRFALEQNYPNPFNPRTVVSAQWTVDSVVRLAVYDALGREVTVLARGRYPAGKYNFTFDGSNFSSGVYFCRLVAGNFTAVRKMTLMK